MSNQAPEVGQHWYWKCDRQNTLVYLGKVGAWHQFAKVEAPKVIWCEVLSEDLRLLEAAQAQKKEV